MKSNMLVINQIIEEFNSLILNLDYIGLTLDQMVYLSDIASNESREIQAGDFIALRDKGVERFKQLNMAIKEYEDADGVDLVLELDVVGDAEPEDVSADAELEGSTDDYIDGAEMRKSKSAM